MSADPEQGTPPGSPAPAAVPAPPQENWEQRYKDTQSWGQQAHDTLGNPEKLASYLRENPERVNEVLQNLGLELLDDDEADDPDYEPEPSTDDTDVTKRLQGLEEKLQAQETQQATYERQAQWDGWENHVKAQASEQGLELSARDIKALKLDCVAPNGYPVAAEQANKVLKAHVEDVNAWLDEQVQQRSKRPRVPHTPGGPGAPAVTEAPSGQEQRVAAMLAAHQAHESGS